MYCALWHGAGFMLKSLQFHIPCGNLCIASSVYAVPEGNRHTILAWIMSALPPCRLSALVLLIQLCPLLAAGYLPYRGNQIHNRPRPHTCFCFYSPSQAMLILQC